ncbi:hypothetical protein G5B40_16935 [Pikeienuella piscinae]|uniref:Basal-body rod modification protein FlgD n=1 Tax=Pikeienuella piscinae TaxID=2748098 RepID=A0A7L5C389_9RHOB|nr:flagellar hook capping FlgD N-terminal domain-containing protein [Pikeienuella piscinae]QIE56976.1 hypothetical protein G5B40_16935 [Pikeienuella piscinae]
METAAITGQTAATGAANANGAKSGESAEPRAEINADFETFLTLLTTQLSNQDPLNPADSTEFVAQLAQFSAVEQQIKTNDQLGSILSALGGEGLGALTPWLGASVEAAAGIPFDGETPIPLSVDADPAATSAFLVAQAENGATVARLPVEPGARRLVWDGTSGAGETLPEGVYRFTLEQANGEEPLASAAPRGFVNVVEARLGETGAELVLESGDVIDAAAISAIRAASD